MTEQRDGYQTGSPEQETAEKLDRWVLEAHAKAAKSLTDLGLIQPRPGEHGGFQISPMVTRRPQSSLLEVSRDSKVDPNKLPWPLNQPDAGLWAKDDREIILGWKDEGLNTFVEIRPGDPTDSMDPVKLSVSRGKSRLANDVQRYKNGMFGFRYSHYPSSGAMITSETFTPKVWTRDEVEAAQARLAKKAKNRTPKGMININHSREREELRLRQLAELTTEGDFTEAVSEQSSRMATLLDFTESDAWKVVNAVNDSLAEAATRGPVQSPSRFSRFFKR